MTEHPRHQLDDLLGHGVRLSIVAALTKVERAEFAFLRDCLQVSDPMLSKQISLLEAAGYVDVLKARAGRRVRTWVALTVAGDAALQRHLRALQAIAGPALPGPAALRETVATSSTSRTRSALDGKPAHGISSV